MVLNITNGTGAQTLDIKQSDWQDEGYAVVGDVSTPGSGPLAVTINSGTLGSGNAALSVASGDALVGGSTVSFGGGTIDIPAADSDPRKDVVWIDATGAIRVDTGQPAQRVPDNATGFATWTPAIPFPDATPATVLAVVFVPANATTIDSSDIQDRRLSADVVRSSVSTVTVDVSPYASGSVIVSGGTREIVDNDTAYNSGNWIIAISIGDASNDNGRVETKWEGSGADGSVNAVLEETKGNTTAVSWATIQLS